MSLPSYMPSTRLVQGDGGWSLSQEAGAQDPWGLHLGGWGAASGGCCGGGTAPSAGGERGNRRLFQEGVGRLGRRAADTGVKKGFVRAEGAGPHS